MNRGFNVAIRRDSRSNPRGSHLRFIARLSRKHVGLTAGLTILLLWLLAPPSIATGQEPPLTFESSAEYSYGQAMRFSLEARSAKPIRKATLLIRTPDIGNTLTAEFDLSPEEDISVSYLLDLTQFRLAPFTTVTYWWSLEDVEGDKHDLEPQMLDYIDDQFTWQSLVHDGIRIYWTGEEPAVGQAAVEAVQSALPKIEAAIPITRPDPLSIYVYPSEADLRAGLRLTGRDWVGAHARPELGVILVAANGTPTVASVLEQSVPHELAHLYLYKATGAGYDLLPLWLDEGLASLVETSNNPSYAVRLEEAVSRGETLDFGDLCYTLPAEEDAALLAYAQSTSFVSYLQNEYGDLALQNLIAEIATGADCQSAPLRALGKSLAELSDEWLEQETPRSTVSRAWQNGRAWLLVIVVGFLLALLLVRPPGAKNR